MIPATTDNTIIFTKEQSIIGRITTQLPPQYHHNLCHDHHHHHHNLDNDLRYDHTVETHSTLFRRRAISKPGATPSPVGCTACRGHSDSQGLQSHVLHIIHKAALRKSIIRIEIKVTTNSIPIEGLCSHVIQTSLTSAMFCPYAMTYRCNLGISAYISSLLRSQMIRKRLCTRPDGK